jgi:hypothetical protein
VRSCAGDGLGGQQAARGITYGEAWKVALRPARRKDEFSMPKSANRGYAGSCNRTPENTYFPDVGKLCVIVPLCTENVLRFSVQLDDEAPEVRFERAVAG